MDWEHPVHLCHPSQLARRRRNANGESNLYSCLGGLPLHIAGSAISSLPKV